MRTRAALYYRVSSDDQSTDLQRHEVEQLVRARGYEVVAVYEGNDSPSPVVTRC